MNRCKGCRWFVPCRDSKMISHIANNEGECRRRAPQWVDSDSVNRRVTFAIVQESSWCGEWEAGNGPREP